MTPLQKHKNILYGTIFFIFLFGAFLRLYHLSNTPYWMDEGYTVNAVDSQIRNGTRNISSLLDSDETYFCPLYCAPTAKIVQFFSHDPASYRILSVIFGLLFIPLIYFFTWSLFQNILVSSFSTIFTALSFWQIAWSRQARWYTMTEFFFWGTLWLFYLFLKETRHRQKYIYLGASIISTLLAIITHRIAYLLPALCLIWYFIEKRPTKKQIAIASASSAAVLLFAEFGLGLHFISHALKHVSLHYTLPYYLSFYLRNYWMFLLLVVYGYFNIKQIETKKKFWMLTTPFLLYLFFLSFFTNIVHYRYLFHSSAAIYILASMALSNILVQVNDLKKNKKIIFAVIILFFISGHGVSWAKDFYFLEADNPASMNRPYYAYTPQPNFNAAYSAIKSNLKKDEIIISSHPHFNKIFLDLAGYWLRYNYLGMEDNNKVITDNKEYYVGASVVNNLNELKQLTTSKHGYILYDYMAADGKIPAETIDYIQKNFSLFFFDEKNEYSKIWVYRF